MFLYANGCSLTWGDELANVSLSTKKTIEQQKTWEKITRNRPPTNKKYWSISSILSDNDEYRLKKSWPGQLKTLLNFSDFENDGFPGGSNKRIVRTTIDWVLYNKHKFSNLFVVIGWTYYSRTEIWDEICNSYKQYNITPNNGMDKDEKKFLENYWQRTYNEYERVNNFLQEIIILQSFLKEKNINYLFFNAIHDINGIKKNININNFQHLINEIDQKRFFKFYDNNFFNWSVTEKKYPHGPGYHPLEKGHNEWAKILATYINENNLLR